MKYCDDSWALQLVALGHPRRAAGERAGPATFVGSGRSAVRPVPLTHWLQTYRSVLSRQGDNYRKVFQETGNLEDGVWSAGIVMGLIDVP